MASLIPQSVLDTFNDLATTYGQIEGIKLQKRLTDAKLSLASASLPSYSSDPQATSQNTQTQIAPMQLSQGTIVLLGLGALVAVYLIAK